MQLRFFSAREIGITIAKMDAQPSVEPNGNYNRNRVINSRCEWTLELKS